MALLTLTERACDGERTRRMILRKGIDKIWAELSAQRVAARSELLIGSRNPVSNIVELENAIDLYTISDQIMPKYCLDPYQDVCDRVGILFIATWHVAAQA